MSNLSAFLNPVTTQEEKEIIISNRFQDEQGKPVPFKIRSVTQEENDSFIKAATTSYRDRTGARATNFDRTKYLHALVVAATVEPDFSSKELCDHFGVVDPGMAATKMLFAGEYQKLSDAIAELSGINDEAGEEAKN